MVSPPLHDVQPEVRVCPACHLGRIRILWDSRTGHLSHSGAECCLVQLDKMFPKGETLEELYLAIVILAFEGFPQFMILGLTMVHWHAPFRSEALELFRETENLNIF